jgi:hypothetical protein
MPEIVEQQRALAEPLQHDACPRAAGVDDAIVSWGIRGPDLGIKTS